MISKAKHDEISETFKSFLEKQFVKSLNEENHIVLRTIKSFYHSLNIINIEAGIMENVESSISECKNIKRDIMELENFIGNVQNSQSTDISEVSS